MMDNDETYEHGYNHQSINVPSNYINNYVIELWAKKGPDSTFQLGAVDRRGDEIIKQILKERSEEKE